jgi:transcriptional regulator with XRE-family HTH domain
MHIKERLRQYRLEESLTQEEFAEKLGISRRTISKLESRDGYRPSISVVKRIAGATGIPSADFYRGGPERELVEVA